MVDIVNEISHSRNGLRNVTSGDPLTKKKSSYRAMPTTQKVAQSNTGRSRHTKKVYVDPNTFIRDEDICTDSISTNETSSQSLFSVSGKSIGGRVVQNKSKPQSTIKPHPPNDGRISENNMDDNSVISNITLSPRS